MTRVLIVEDELLIADRIASYLQRSEVVPEVTFVGPVATCAEAQLSVAQAGGIELAIIDLRLEGGDSGLDFAAWLRQAHPGVPFLFLTSQFGGSYLEAAAALEPRAYLTKPIQPRTLCAAVVLALAGGPGGKPAAEASVGPGDPAATTITLVTREGPVAFALADLRYVQADHVYSSYHFVDREPVVVREGLGEIEGQLPSESFSRVHRSYIVNLARVTRRTASRLWIDDVEIPIGRSRRGGGELSPYA